MTDEDSLKAGSQGLMLAAGYEPKNDWVFIDDLVQEFRTQQGQRQDLLGALDAFLATSGAAITRKAFKQYTSAVRAEEIQRRNQADQEGQLAVIYAQSDVLSPDAGHAALALRIVELERAVKTYADRVRALEEEAGKPKSSGFLPFVAGVAIGGALF